MNDYEQRLLYAINKISQNFKKEIHDFQKSSHCELSLTDCSLIETIGGNSLTLNEIANNSQLTPGTLSPRIEKLVNEDFLKRYRGDIDRRKTYISLSQKGLEYYKMLNENVLKLCSETLDDLNEEEKQKAVEIFEKMSKVELK